MKRLSVILMSFALLSAVLAVSYGQGAAAVAGTGTGGAGNCTASCHDETSGIKKFGNGDYVQIYVDQKVLGDSVHKSLSCVDCHTAISGPQHSTRSFRSKAQYSIRESKSCRRCHMIQDIRSGSLHEILIKREASEGKPMVCVDCHGAHAVRPVTRGSAFSAEGKYCQECHGFSFNMKFTNGEESSVLVDPAELDASAHMNLVCSDCHFGFSSESHLHRRFRSSRDYTLASSDICKRCHSDKYTKVSESIHFDILSQGKLSAPSCIDCHGGHGISRISHRKLDSIKKCRNCHTDVYDIYAQSVHGNALFEENNNDVPICIDCHSAHSQTDPRTVEFHERIPQMCSNCHADEEIAKRYGISTSVTKTYLSDFHGITLELQKMGRGEFEKPQRPIAVCTDCHGTHGITRTSGTDPALIKKKLLERCSGCHEGATENFPDAWLSHYEPSLKKATGVYVVSIALKVLIPLMLVGLALQVFLHIWRYIVNR